MRLIITLILILFPCVAYSKSDFFNIVSNMLLENNIVYRDSGKAVTKDFLSDCIKQQSLKRFKLECEDVIFSHYISVFEMDEGSKIVLVTKEGASVENRWLMLVQSKGYVDVINKMWPIISDKEVSRLLTQQTGMTKYSPTFVKSVAHSSYRVQHTAEDTLIVLSGIPDETYKTKLGVIKWKGVKFEFIPVSN